MKIRWIGDNAYGHIGYANNVRELVYELNKLCDAKIIQQKIPDTYLPPKCESIMQEEYDIDSETHCQSRVWVAGSIFKLLNDLKVNPRSLSCILVLEGDRLPKDHVATANLMTYLWTASTYGEKQFIANGIIPEKVKVIPHGIDPNVFYPRIHVQKSNDFTFLFNGGFAIPGDRKGADILVQAFKEEFKEYEHAKLIMKINPAYLTPQSPAAQYLRELGGIHKKVFVSDEAMTQEQLAEMYSYSDVHVLPTKGEAFSMNLAESMACGKTVIATNWSGHLDFCKPEFSYLIDVEKFVVAHYSKWDIECGSRWAFPSIQHLKQLMRYCFENQDEVRKKGQQAQRFILDNYLWSHAARKMHDYLKVFD